MVIPEETNVLVVGAGPVGLTLALLLHRAGIATTVVDRDAAPIEQSRAVWVHSRTLEIWDAIGMTPLARTEGRVVNAIEMHLGGRARAKLPYDGTGVSLHPHGLMLEQSRSQSLLLSLLAETDVSFSWEADVTSIVQKDDVCEVAITDAAGEQRTVKATFVVGADGGSSSVRKLTGISMEGGTYDSTFFLVDVRGSSPLEPSHSHLNFTGRSTIAVLPLPDDGHFRIIGNMVDQDRTDASTGGYGRTLTDGEISRLLAANALPMSIESVGWSATYRSHHRVACTFRRGRVLLAGDAAHLHSPAGGLGMNTGIADAANLAWRMADVLAGAPDSLLDAYGVERRDAARGVIQTSDRLFTLQADTRASIAFVRRHLLPLVARQLGKVSVGRRAAFRALSGIYVRYAEPRGKKVGSICAGELLHLTGAPALDDIVRNPPRRHTIVRLHADASTDPRAAALARERGWEFIDVSSSEAAGVLGTRSAGVTMWIRPDRYIGWVGDDLTELMNLLTDEFGHPRGPRDGIDTA